MKIAIIAAMSKEISLILKQMKDVKVTDIDGIEVHEGNIGGNHIILSKCGIGKVNSALATYRLIRAFNPDLVINSGVAGGVDASMRIGDVLVADRIAYHDVWCGPGTEYGAADGYPVYLEPYAKGIALMKEIASASQSNIRFGLLCSGDMFISLPSEVKEIKRKYPDALGCDMESASIAQVCTMCGVPFMIIRVMSDMPGGGENIAEYNNFWDIAPDRTFETVSEMISRL